jgi:AcrR family transcriptional regulator
LAPGTRNAILDTAERLFAQHGLQGASVRKILSQAGVNVALAHYYFGSRDGLIRELLRRRVEPLNEQRLRLLAEVEMAAGLEGARLEALLRAFFTPAIVLLDEHPDFARLIGQLHVAANPRLRDLFIELFGDVLHRFSEPIRRVLPSRLSGPQLVSRIQFTFGALILTLTNHSDMKLMARGRYEVPRSEALVEELVTFCAAGLTAQTKGDGDSLNGSS